MDEARRGRCAPRALRETVVTLAARRSGRPGVPGATPARRPSGTACRGSPEEFLAMWLAGLPADADPAEAARALLGRYHGQERAIPSLFELRLHDLLSELAAGSGRGVSRRAPGACRLQRGPAGRMVPLRADTDRAAARPHRRARPDQR